MRLQFSVTRNEGTYDTKSLTYWRQCIAYILRLLQIILNSFEQPMSSFATDRPNDVSKL